MKGVIVIVGVQIVVVLMLPAGHVVARANPLNTGGLIVREPDTRSRRDHSGRTWLAIAHQNTDDKLAPDSHPANR